MSKQEGQNKKGQKKERGGRKKREKKMKRGPKGEPTSRDGPKNCSFPSELLLEIVRQSGPKNVDVEHRRKEKRKSEHTKKK